MIEVPVASGRMWVPYRVRRSKRARHVRLTMSAENAVLVVPRGYSLERAEQFLQQQREWLAKQWAQRPHRLGFRDYLERQPWLTGLGRRWRVQILFQQQSNWRLDPDNGRIILNIETRKEDVEKQLHCVLWSFGKSVLEERVRELADKVGAPALVRVGVRDASTRWGSCSENKGVSLNWRLVLLNPALQDYVLYHELAHLTEMNHSGRFWALLTRYDPKARFHDRKIKELGPQIIAIGR